MTINEIRTAIFSTFTSEEVNQLSQAISNRRDMDKHRAIATSLSELSVGDSVIFKNLREKYNGLQGKITEIKRVKAHVRINESEFRAGARRGRVVIVPLNCVQKIKD